MLDSSVLIAAEGQKFRPGLLTVTKNGRRQSPSAFQELSKPSYKLNRRKTGPTNSIWQCARGLVPERCGGKTGPDR
jgi:hypothetical protein